MKTEDIRISVVIPCYNAEKTIEKAINSVLNGNFLPHEILIYDDFSNDNTASIIEDKFVNNQLVSFYKGTANKGAGYARQVLLEKATGNFIAFLDADDWWYPRKLEQQVSILSVEKCDIVTCGYDVYAESGEILGSRIPFSIINIWSMHLANWLSTSMTIFRKDLTCAAEMPQIRKRQDYGFWLKIFKNNKHIKCSVVNERLGGYLRRSNSLSSGKISNLRHNYMMFRKVLGYSHISSAVFVFLNVIVRLFRT